MRELGLGLVHIGRGAYPEGNGRLDRLNPHAGNSNSLGICDGLKEASASFAPPLPTSILAQSHSSAFAILFNEDHAGLFERGSDCRKCGLIWLALAGLEICNSRSPDLRFFSQVFLRPAN
jgi:hypothetical protein